MKKKLKPPMQKLKPPIPWYGGKALVVDELLPYVPPHECYLEPYGGSGALLFAKEPSKVEAYNDLHGGVVNFYRVLRDKPQKLIELLNLTPYSREEYVHCWRYIERVRQGEEYDSIEYARCFFTIARQSFGGILCRLYIGQKNPGGNWSRSTQRNVALSWANSIDRLPAIHNRLRGVQIENKPALEVIKQFDSKDTFIYLDPPYVTSTRKEKEGYNHEMTDRDHFALLATIKQCKSMILLSGYNNELYEEVLNASEGWHYSEFSHRTQFHSSSDVDCSRVESLWWNEALEVNRTGSQMKFGWEV
jgi:DNA adenine methylase